MFPLTAIYSFAEIANGRIDHCLRATVYKEVNAWGRFVWPALRSDGLSNDTDAPPMGSFLRLKATIDISGFGSQSKVIAQALKEYGMYIADSTVSSWSLYGEK